MTVGELINELKRYPQEMQVCLHCTYDSGYGTTGGKIDDVKEEYGRVYLENNEG